MSMAASQPATAILGVYGGSELIARGSEVCLRPASWGECFYAKLGTYLQFAAVIVVALLVDSLNYPAWPVIALGAAFIAAYPICWELVRRAYTKVLFTHIGQEILIRGREKAALKQISLEVRKDRLNGHVLLLIVEGGHTHRIMGHIDTRPLEALAAAIEDQLGIRR